MIEKLAVANQETVQMIDTQKERKNVKLDLFAILIFSSNS
jgi:hypothetical protein